jgi:hypothetical protein
MAVLFAGRIARSQTRETWTFWITGRIAELPDLAAQLERAAGDDA